MKLGKNRKMLVLATFMVVVGLLLTAGVALAAPTGLWCHASTEIARLTYVTLNNGTARVGAALFRTDQYGGFWGSVKKSDGTVTWVTGNARRPATCDIDIP